MVINSVDLLLRMSMPNPVQTDLTVQGYIKMDVQISRNKAVPPPLPVQTYLSLICSKCTQHKKSWQNIVALCSVLVAFCDVFGGEMYGSGPIAVCGMCGREYVLLHIPFSPAQFTDKRA